MVAYRSRQYLYQNPIARWLPAGLAAACVVLFAVGGAWSEPGDSAVAWAAIAVTLAALIALLWAPLTITVDESHVRVSLAGVVKKAIALDDVTAVERRTYRPLTDFGGWGWRWSRKIRGAVAYTTRGDTAVVLTVRGGSLVYLGVDDEPGLLEALSARVRT